ncbi:MAG: OmpA family protein [Candidatus Azobacteroides sp.]|nr:OmpA family protein [Candidatus Azobacteroides sp.]
MNLERLLTLTFVSSLFFAGTINAQELPPTAQPGKCYVKCITADEYRDVTETVVIKPEYKVLTTTPATYKTIEEKVLVKEASKRYVIHPAVYETVSVDYESRSAETVLDVVAARFGNSSKTIQVQPKSGRWEYKKLDNCPSVNKDECMVACYVEYPEVNEAIPITVLEADASTRSTTKPGLTASYKKDVVKTPASVEEIEVPAEYKTIKKVVVDTPAGVKETVVPAVTKVITKKELVKKGGITVWEEVDCSLLEDATLLPIFYDYNSAKLTPASEKIIDDYLLKLMKDKPGLRIEIMSHTDSRGNDDYNMALSQQRAQSVVNYLVSKGISRDRLVAKGYGETRLKNRCANGVDCTEEEHQQNRRTEFRIIQ